MSSQVRKASIFLILVFYLSSLCVSEYQAPIILSDKQYFQHITASYFSASIESVFSLSHHVPILPASRYRPLQTIPSITTGRCFWSGVFPCKHTPNPSSICHPVPLYRGFQQLLIKDSKRPVYEFVSSSFFFFLLWFVPLSWFVSIL